MVIELVALTMAVIVIVRFLVVRARLAHYDPSLRSPLPPSLAIDGVEAYLQAREDSVAPLRPSNGSFIRWVKGKRGKQVDTVVVFMHGFSASPRECEPTDIRIAEELGAHLLRYRLSGHGLAGDFSRAGVALRDSCGRDAYLHDMSVAFALAKLIGRRVVVVGSSTGGSLAVWLASQPWAQPDLAALVLFSPAFAIAKVGTAVYNALKWLVLMLPRAGCTAVLQAINGPINRVPTILPIQHEIWTMEYPTESVAHCLEIYVSLEVGVDMGQILAPTLAFCNPDDKVRCLQLRCERIEEGHIHKL